MLLKNDTQYASGYDENKFRRIRTGFTKDLVLQLIGEPLNKRVYNPGDEEKLEEYWWYSKSPSSTHFHHRFIVFSNKGVVKRLGHEFYVD